SAETMRDENSIKNKWRYKISDIEVNHFNSFTFFLSRFQEIVPLNAGNVLGAEDNLPAKKWLSLIRKTLNTLPGTCSSSNYSILSPLPDPLVELDADFEGSSTRQRNSSLLHRHSFHSMRRSLRIDGDIMVMQPRLDRRFSVCDRASIASRPSNFDPSFRCGGSSDDEKPGGESPATDIFSPMSYVYGAPQYLEERERSSLRSKYYSLRFLSLIPFDSILSDINLIYSIDSEWCCYSITVLGIAWWQLIEIFLFGQRCDRILWYGRGLTQLAYLHGESRFSDHRPVYSIFTAEVETTNDNQIKNMGCSSSRVEVEELLPYSHGFTEFSFY
ncbi:hypothetical protein B296_00009483, partial [Ensete ventricosum]